MKNKSTLIFLNTLPIILMMILIPYVVNDYMLTGLYALIIFVSFCIKKIKGEISVFLFGFFVMIGAEALFISTGVEIFVRNSLLGLMPLWLPFLWGYSFVAMKRGIKILEL